MITVTALELAFFAGAMAVLVYSPGPLTAAVSARAAAFGFRSGALMAIGAMAGESVWIATALLGLGAIAAAHAWALDILRYVGAAWLIWIGLNLVFGRHGLIKAGPVRREAPWRGFVTGALLNIGNPKAAIFYMTLFPGFFDIANLTAWDAVLIFTVATPIGLSGDLFYAWGADRLRARLSNPRTIATVDRATGGVLVGAGTAIAAS
ncbi:MAG: LysE family translocator [Pseudomonadota bacterium]